MLNLNNDPAIAYLWQEIVRLFVRKEPGKGLSTEDFSTGEKKKLAGLPEAYAEKYAVGDIYVTMREGDPSALLGYGSWERITGRFLLAAGDGYTAGSTGGEKEHVLTRDELPWAEFRVRQVGNCTATYLSGYATPSTEADGGIYSSVITLQGNGWYKSTVSWDGKMTACTDGKNTPFTNMPPYLAVNMWLRTA